MPLIDPDELACTGDGVLELLVQFLLLFDKLFLSAVEFWLCCLVGFVEEAQLELFEFVSDENVSVVGPFNNSVPRGVLLQVHAEAVLYKTLCTRKPDVPTMIPQLSEYTAQMKDSNRESVDAHNVQDFESRTPTASPPPIAHWSLALTEDCRRSCLFGTVLYRSRPPAA